MKEWQCGVYMEIYFNELSLNELSQIQYQDFQRIKDVYVLLKSNGINTCRISNDDYRVFLDQIQGMGRTGLTFRNFMFSFFRVPYETPIIDEKQDQYLSHHWTLQEKDCYGLALAFIVDSMTLSTGNETWNQPFVQICRDDYPVTVRNLYGTETFYSHLPWLSEMEEIQLVECNIPPEKKKIDLSDDHGKDELMTFCKRIRNSQYICEIVNSTEFHSHQRRFIFDIRDDGIIEIVLPWTDAGYGVVVKTTGRNKRETRIIAEILKEKYGTR